MCCKRMCRKRSPLTRLVVAARLLHGGRRDFFLCRCGGSLAFIGGWHSEGRCVEDGDLLSLAHESPGLASIEEWRVGLSFGSSLRDRVRNQSRSKHTGSTASSDDGRMNRRALMVNIEPKKASKYGTGSSFLGAHSTAWHPYEERANHFRSSDKRLKGDKSLLQ